MRRILSAEQMRQADQSAMAMGLPSMVLMERAALAVVEEMTGRGLDLSRVCVVCGTGNNGGDGVAAARILCERGWRPAVCLTGNPEKYSEQLKQQIRIAENYPVTFINSFRPSEYTVIIDAIFGIGLRRPVAGTYREIIDGINSSGGTVVSVDIPSGIHTDTGEIMGTAVRADLTVTFARGKTGLYLYPGAACAGTVVVRDIGIPVGSGPEGGPGLYCLEPSDLSCLPARDPSGNKGTFRKLLVIAGSDRMCGAAYLAARAALMTGIGMVKIYTPEANRLPLSVLLPEALISTYRESAWNLQEFNRDLEWADSVVIGPGLGTSEFAGRLLAYFLDRNELPCVIDADALNLLASKKELWNALKAPCIITPHVGEMCRLMGTTPEVVKKDLIETARRFATLHQVTCILKDARSVTALPDGRCYLNLSGNSGLATAGSGDVLSGIAAGLAAQYPQLPVPPAVLAAYVHGLCGESASSKYSESSMTARNVLEAIPEYL